MTLHRRIDASGGHRLAQWHQMLNMDPPPGAALGSRRSARLRSCVRAAEAERLAASEIGQGRGVTSNPICSTAGDGSAHQSFGFTMALCHFGGADSPGLRPKPRDFARADRASA